MSLPIYVLPYKVDIENKLKELNFDDKDIKSIFAHHCDKNEFDRR